MHENCRLYGDAIAGSGKEGRMEFVIAVLVVIILVIVILRLT
jgi:hypothetical protein